MPIFFQLIAWLQHDLPIRNFTYLYAFYCIGAGELYSKQSKSNRTGQKHAFVSGSRANKESIQEASIPAQSPL